MWSDLKYALRSLLKTPSFTTIAILTLGLGIGATTAIFSVVNAVVLRPLPYAQPERLVRIYSEFPNFANGGLRRFQLSYPEYLDLRTAATSWESIDGWISTGVNIAAVAEPARVTASMISGGLMQSLGVAPVLGRAITPQDDTAGAPPVAVISHGLWQRAFAGSDAILGEEVLVNGKKHVVVGVMAKGFQFPPGEIDVSELWVPLQIDAANPGDRAMHNLNVLGRLQQGVTLRQAHAELDALVAHWAQTASNHHFDPRDHTLVAYGLHDEVVGGVKTALVMLMVAVGFLLLIACVNVANLLLARAEARQRETAIRSALGASLGRLTLQFVSEGLVLSCMGVTLGLLLAHGSLELLKAASAASIPRSAEIAIDGHVIVFAVAVSLITSIAFGLAPLFHVMKRDLHGAMKSAAASTTDSAGSQRFRQALVVGQLALALILLMGTGLMLRAFSKLQEVNAGFDPRAVTTMFVALPPTVPGDGARDFWSRLETRLSALPGVEGAALTSALPPIEPQTHMDTDIEGFVSSQAAPVQSVEYYHVVSKDYFKTMRVRLLEGRLLDSRDDTQAPKAVVINQTMARTFWQNQSPVGRRIRPSIGPDWYTIVGVVDDAKNGGLDKPTGTEVYFSHLQTPQGSDFLRFAYIAVRASGAPGMVVNAARREVSEIDPSLPLARIRSMDEVVSEARSRPRFLTMLLSLFAGVALILATVGIYGVISYSVAQRTKELGLRMALGAQPGDVLRLVLRRGMLLIAFGVLIGLAGALALTRFLAGLLYGITATDPATFITVSLVLSVVAIVASYLPARHATKVDPMIALRAE